MKTSKRTAFVAIIPISLLAFFLAPMAGAYGSGDNWQIGVSATGTQCIQQGCGGFGFWGWCTFSGSTSGTVGDCAYSQYLHLAAVGSPQCETHFDITAWHTAPSPTRHRTDFWIDSGALTVNPASATDACVNFLEHAGFALSQTSSGAWVFVPSSDTGIPATPGHYDFNGLVTPPCGCGPVVTTFTQFQIQVSDSS